MRILKIELENYGPFFGKHEFSLEHRGLTLILGDNQDEPRMNSNGAGKSSILDALDFALFGKVPRNDHVDSVINDEAKSCAVRVYMQDDLGRDILVERNRGKSTTARLVVDGGEVEALDIKETQKAIELVLGVDREVFHSAVLFAQTDLVHYAESNDVERMNILTKILQLGVIDDYLEIAKESERKSIKMRELTASKIAAKIQVLESLSDRDFETNIADWEVSKKQRLAQFTESMQGIIHERDKGVQLLAEMSDVDEFTLAQLKAAYRQIPLPSNTDLLTAKKRAQDIDLELVVRIREYGSKVEELNRWKARGEGFCVSCGQEVSADYLSLQIRKYQNDLPVLERDLQDRQKELEAAQATVGGYQVVYDQQNLEYQRLIQQYTYDIGRLEQKVAQVASIKDRVASLDRELAIQNDMYRKAELEVNPWLEQKEYNASKIRTIKKEIKALEAERQVVMDEGVYIDFWLKAFGSKGLKSYILDARLQELTDAVNRWVTVLTGGTIWVQFATQKKTRSNKVVNSPTVRVCRWNPNGTITERNFQSWSGGEKQRISFAIDFGLSRLIAQRAKNTYNLLILDEVFRHLDQGGKEAVMEMLSLLAQEKSTVVVVEHDTEFQAAFEDRILVRKKNGRSTIMELGNEQNNTTEKAGNEVSSGGTKRRKILSSENIPGRRVKRTPF